MAATPSVPLKQLDDITECPICTELYTDPRVLPCIHTYCLKCIEKWGSDKIRDGKLACPVCRKEVDITTEGFADLPKNFFVGKLLEVRKLASALSVKETLCDVCSEDQGKQSELAGKFSTATVYCTECRRNMCQTCLGCHQKFRSSTPHKLIELEKQQSVEELLQKFPESFCDKHPDKNLEIYCFDCKLVTCMMCYITSHNGHKCSDVKQVAEELSRQMKIDADGFEGRDGECKELLQLLEKGRKEFVENVNHVEKQIINKAEELKQMIEDYKVKLLDEVNSTRKQYEKNVESLCDELQGRLLMFESFKRYSDELRNKGTPCDVARTASSLHERAAELMKFEVRKEIKVHTCTADIKFVSQQIKPDEKIANLFGELFINIGQTNEIKDIVDVDFSPSPKPLHIIPGTGSSVSGVTSLGEELFVVRNGSAQIDVYDASTFALQRNLSLGGATAKQSSLTSCNVNNCLYMSVYNSNKVYRVDVSGGNKVTSWSVGSQPFGLTVNIASNVLVACRGSNKIQEYTTHGSLVRDISLQSDVTYPLNVVQLSSELFGVTHQGSLNRYCVVGLDGRVVKSYGGSRGSGAGQMNGPYGLTPSTRGKVFIADYYNSRILMLDPSTLNATPLTVEGGVTNAFCVHYDKLHCRLYIGEYGTGSYSRVFVLENQTIDKYSTI